MSRIRQAFQAAYLQLSGHPGLVYYFYQEDAPATFIQGWISGPLRHADTAFRIYNNLNQRVAVEDTFNLSYDLRIRRVFASGVQPRQIIGSEWNTQVIHRLMRRRT